MEKTETGKVKVIGVRFRTAGKIYFFDPGEFELSRGMHVVVETARGMEYGFVVGSPMEVDGKSIQQPLKSVIRISTPEDDEREKRNREREREAFKVCRERIRLRGLDMKLIDAEYTFDDGKILFYFTADGRIDFRELVKDLASVFRTRIELRQVGVRDEAKILGGYGSCGRPLCCHTWLSDFVPVSIKMAKEQNLSLNPGKISGVCGRLMCCLKNESETYEELNKTLPHPGDEVEAADGMNGLVESVNILRQTARIIVEVDDEKELHEYHVSDLTILRRRRRGTSRPTMQKNTPAKNAGSAKNAGKETAEKDNPGREYAGRDRSGKDSSEREYAGRGNSGKEFTGRDKSGKDHSERDYTGKNNSGKGNPGTNRFGTDRFGTDRSGAERSATDRSGKEAGPGNAQRSGRPQGPAQDENGREQGRRENARFRRDRRNDRRPGRRGREEQGGADGG